MYTVMDCKKMFPFASQCIGFRCGLHLKENQCVHVCNDTCKEPCSFSGKHGIYNSKGGFTACAPDTHHMTKKEAIEMIPKIVMEFITNGCAQTIRVFEKSPGDIRDIYKKVAEDDIDINGITDAKASYGNKIIRYYMPHLIDVEDHRGVKISDGWTEDRLTTILMNAIENKKVTNVSYISEILKKLKFSPVTIYSPLMTKRILEFLNCRTVFDPCIGWGGRMIGTIMVGGSYTGCEPFTKTFQGLTQMKDDLNLSNVKLYNLPVEDVLESLGDKTYDICLTSPPYYDLEIYSNEQTQSTQRYQTYDIWLSDFLKPIIDYVCSHVTKYSCWSVKNFKTGDTHNLLDDVIRLHEENGWMKCPLEFSIKKNTQKNAQATGDVTYVFQKQDISIDISTEAGVLQKPLILTHPEHISKIADEYAKAKKLQLGNLAPEDQGIADAFNASQGLPDIQFASKGIITLAQSSQCNEIYEENISDIFGNTNLTDKHGFDGVDKQGVYYEYKPTKPKATGNPMTANVSINDDSDKKIKKCEDNPDTWFIIAVIDRDTCHYKMIYKFPMRVLTEDRKKYFNDQVKKNSRRIVYGTHIKKCIRHCIQQREEFYRWIPEDQ